MAGVGKSTVARQLATRLGRPVVDLDIEIASRRGLSVSEIFALDGEAGFRACETETLAAVLAGATPVVLATGGGAVIAAENRAMLADDALTVWLRAEAAVIVSRLERSRTKRPLLEGDLAANVERLLLERAPLFASVADVVVDVDTTIATVVDAVLEAVA